MDNMIELDDELPDLKRNLSGISMLVLLVAIIGAVLAWRFVETDTERDERNWQERLNLIAESRTADISAWVGNHFKELRTLADNPSLKLYMSELETMRQNEQSTADGQNEPAQKTYLRNLLLFTADRMGFSGGSVAAAQIPANVEPPKTGALLVASAQGQVVVSTPLTRELLEPLLQKTSELPVDKDSLIDLYKDSDNTLLMAFVLPVKSIQDDATLGRIIGIKPVETQLFPLLKHPGSTEKTLEAMLVRKRDDELDYLTPLIDGSSPLNKSLEANPDQLAEAEAIAAPGSFVKGKDYRGKNVFEVAQAVAGTPWFLVLKIDRHEAMAASDARRASMIVAFAVIIGMIALLLVTIWWRATSKRSILLSKQFKALAERATAQKQLLGLVTDHQDDSLYIIDEQRNYRFANQKAGKEAGMSAEHMLGKPVADVIGAARAEVILHHCAEALTGSRPIDAVEHVLRRGEERIFRSDYIPVENLPVPGEAFGTRGVLLVEHDITELEHEREKRVASLNQLVATLVRIVDKRDPYAANQSELVSRVSAALAQKLELSAVMVETTRIAGSLVNLGKIVVSAETLTKAENLDMAERKALRETVYASADLLKGVEFEGPVVETLRQLQETMVSEDVQSGNLLISTRIIGAVNAFIAMVSPRAWRPAVSVAEALKKMQESDGKRFDRSVVIALADYMENHDGKELLKQVALAA